MSKTFFTERDIEDLAKRGVKSIDVNDDVVLTELALEKAQRLGVVLVREHETPPSAPIRPYIAAVPRSKPSTGVGKPQSRDELYQRVYAAVVKRLGDEVNHSLLDTIIRRVIDNIEIR